MLLNLESVIPAVILLILHFWLGWSVWWAVLAFGLWIIYLVIWMDIVGWARKCGNTPDPWKENKNPYSYGKYPK